MLVCWDLVVRLESGIKRETIIGTHTSREVMPCLFFKSSTASRASVSEVFTILTIINLLPAAVGI